MKTNNFSKTRELIYNEEKLISWSIGYSICTVYWKSMDANTIELMNFGYCPTDKEFYFTHRVHLPREIVNYFNGADYNKENIEKMQEFGIYNGNDLERLTEIYETAKKEVVTAKIQMETEKKKILSFQKSLIKNKCKN